MRRLGLSVGVVVMIVAAISFAAPDLRLAVERSAMTVVGLWTIAVLRVALGLVFVLTAPASRAAWLLRALGLVMIIAGLLTPWFGVSRAQAVVDWLTNAGPLWMRLDAVRGMGLRGLFVFMFPFPILGLPP